MVKWAVDLTGVDRMDIWATRCATSGSEIWDVHVVDPAARSHIRAEGVLLLHTACGLMEGDGSSRSFDICIAFQKGKRNAGLEKDAVGSYIRGLKEAGLFVEEEDAGLEDISFIKIDAPVEVIGRAAERLKLKKSTYLGLDVPFVWEQRDAFIRQAVDNALFTWSERYNCIDFLMQSVANETDAPAIFTLEDEESRLEVKLGEKLLEALRRSNVVTDVFPLHDERIRKELWRSWALNWKGLTSQPIDAVHAYFGPKVAIYFAFLGLYTQWLMIPAVLAFYLHFKEFRKWGPAVPVFFSVLSVVWSVLFLQFWKRKNATLLTRWGVALDRSEDTGAEENVDFSAVNNDRVQAGGIHQMDIDKLQKRTFQKNELFQQLKSARNYAIVVVGIIFVQLPYELAYAHLNKVVSYEILKYLLTVVYLLGIQVFTNLGGKLAVRLTKTEQYASKEAEADGLIYKVFGIYFMQSYIGLFYHALFHRDFVVLRQFLVQRLIIAQIISNISENVVPYLSYLYAKFKAHKAEEQDNCLKKKDSWLEEEYLRPEYRSSVGDNLEDGLFDDFLELALQFGMVTMFACSFPLVFIFAIINNLVEIRSDAIKLLLMFRRPRPREAGSIGAWLQIFQYLGVVAICTNCALLVCLYDEAGQWNVEPGMAAILVMEHLLLLAKFGFACFVPEEPAWVKAKRARRSRLQEQYIMQVLTSGKHKDL